MGTKWDHEKGVLFYTCSEKQEGKLKNFFRKNIFKFATNFSRFHGKTLETFLLVYLIKETWKKWTLNLLIMSYL